MRKTLSTVLFAAPVGASNDTPFSPVTGRPSDSTVFSTEPVFPFFGASPAPHLHRTPLPIAHSSLKFGSRPGFLGFECLLPGGHRKVTCFLRSFGWALIRLRFDPSSNPSYHEMRIFPCHLAPMSRVRSLLAAARDSGLGTSLVSWRGAVCAARRWQSGNFWNPRSIGRPRRAGKVRH